MRTLLYLILFSPINLHSQTDSLTIYKKQIEPDSIELVNTQIRINKLKLELDSLKSESKKNQILISELNMENIRLTELMKKYLDELKRKEQPTIKEEE